ncbi:phosphate ABC transporter permease PstA [Agrococcus casei]|uniref:Phosphate transport system permease protein PstA n=2 Tax=Agrococcus TaxID=46352 RepID=A0A1R4EUI1_9MICO|nr:phosphate ABC transporter permease PstA [Agrococcus casei]SJM47236.1 Phosphate transport system permease protein PstA (TC 3.A.1.7.1) [Agrococcus casei LMG 22410]
MTTATAATGSKRNTLTAGQLSKWAPWVTLAASFALAAGLFMLVAVASSTDFSWAGVAIVGYILFLIILPVVSRIVEGGRKAMDRFMTGLVTGAFLLAFIPLLSLMWTVVSEGAARFDVQYFTESMRNVVGEGGGAIHALVGTLLVTLGATVISVPVGIFTAIYLVEYGRGWVAKGITTLVDIMTGIPSIVTGLFAFALFSLLFSDPGYRSGIGGSVALSVLMIPTVVRSTEEMLKLVPNELREASYALGVPKWLTIVKVVLPTALAGIATGVTLAIARVIGETAPLLIIAGFTASMNYNLFSERMMTLPVYVYNQYIAPGMNVSAAHERAWTGALTLILIVVVLNLIARLVAKIFAPKAGR